MLTSARFVVFKPNPLNRPTRHVVADPTAGAADADRGSQPGVTAAEALLSTSAGRLGVALSLHGGMAPR